MADPSDAQEIAEFLDRQKIWNCHMAYCRGVDRIDFDLIRAAFWDDAIITHGPVRGSVDDMIDAWFPGQTERDSSFHNVSNMWVVFDGDQAHCETYITATIKLKAKSVIETIGGRYIDHFVKRGRDWRIQTRLMVIDWQGEMDASGMQERLATRHRGSRDRSDPSYERPVRPRDPILTPWLPGHT